VGVGLVAGGPYRTEHPQEHPPATISDSEAVEEQV
jgi:hypothetical protein